MVGVVAPPSLALQHDRARAVAEQYACGTVFPVEQLAHGLRANQKDRLRLPRLDEIVGDRHAVDEARANRLHVERRAVLHAEPGL